MSGSAANAATARPVNNGVSMGEFSAMPVYHRSKGAHEKWGSSRIISARKEGLTDRILCVPDLRITDVLRGQY